MRLVGLLLLAAAVPLMAGCGTAGSTATHAVDPSAAARSPRPTPSTPSAPLKASRPGVAVQRVDPAGHDDDVRMTASGFDPATVFAPAGEAVSFRRDRHCASLRVQGMGRVDLGRARDAAFRFERPGRYTVTDPDGDRAVVVVSR